jgi:hypothetical protein
LRHNQIFAVVLFQKHQYIRVVKSGVVLPICLLAALGSSVAVQAGTANDGVNPFFDTIVVRNAFDLKPPPPPPSAPVTVTPPTQVRLIGIARIFGVKKALLKITDGGKPVDPAKDPTVVLEEGQREKEVTLLEIDETNATVRVDNRGQIALVPFDKEGTKLPTAPPMPGIVLPPGMVPRPAAGVMMLPPPGNPVPPNFGGVMWPGGQPAAPGFVPAVAPPTVGAGLKSVARPLRGGIRPLGEQE